MTTFNFPVRHAAPIIETNLMRDVENRSLAIHNRSPLVVWTGNSGLGKTTTAAWLTNRINEAFSADNPNAFRAKHYEATELADWHSVGKTAMGALHSGVLGELDSGLYKRLRANELADLVVIGLIRQRIEVVCLDEAGLYGLRALRGLVAIRDRAVQRGHRLTLILIGMDDLPIKIKATPQIDGRVHEWCLFEPYSLSETIELVNHLTELWSGADMADPQVRRQFEFIHSVTSGVARQIAVFVDKAQHAASQLDRPLSVAFLRAVHLRTTREQKRSEQAAMNNYRPSKKPEETNPTPTGAA